MLSANFVSLSIKCFGIGAFNRFGYLRTWGKQEVFAKLVYICQLIS